MSLLNEPLRKFAPSLPLAVAYSGGADSTALLLACAEKWPGQIVALHVHHGLQAAADKFVQHCQNFCQQIQVPLHIAHVDARHMPGESPENRARQARYQALTDMLQQAELCAVRDIALAQHADDQIETILLALSRGAGIPGLAAMPAQWQRNGYTWHRPLLNTPMHDLRAWLNTRNIQWIEDPTNTDERYTRNRIRARLLPVLQEVFPEFRTTFARTASHAAQAQELLQELAARDLSYVGTPPDITCLQNLSAARQANVLRHWFRQHCGTTPSAAQMQALLAQIAACRTRAHRIHLKVGRGMLERQNNVLFWQEN